MTQQKQNHPVWNKGKLIGQKPPLKLQEIWGIRTRLEINHQHRDLAMFNLAIDSKLRCCDLVKLKVRDVMHGNTIQSRAMVMQQKTKRPVQFEITKNTRDALEVWIQKNGLGLNDYLFGSKVNPGDHISGRQYARIVDSWVALIGLDPADYGTHSMRRTKPTLIYKKTKNIRAVQLLLGHSNLESTVRYLGIETDDALEMAEQLEI
ncbi:tyrosine-type recombinase/integrase [Reinekea marinisedimentorum]|uniref:Phage integrase family protein n=1 Tax=Reinekea marinisedimentorum TaxID=230495 RepID=A0A4R3I3Q9_9GAMM|nr:tyrosine-type recombinase/integrase [Reinekea marinisedimentorum]TCS40204.1 phage integrase family protein [Reinekea marinisedimentorum]